jgi:hypothetical protein
MQSRRIAAIRMFSVLDDPFSSSVLNGHLGRGLLGSGSIMSVKMVAKQV